MISNSSASLKTHRASNEWPIWAQKVLKEAQRCRLQTSILVQGLLSKIFCFISTVGGWKFVQNIGDLVCVCFRSFLSILGRKTSKKIFSTKNIFRKSLVKRPKVQLKKFAYTRSKNVHTLLSTLYVCLLTLSFDKPTNVTRIVF